MIAVSCGAVPATEAVPKITKARKRKAPTGAGGDPEDQDDDEKKNGETPGPNQGRRGTKRRTADGTALDDDRQTTAATVNPAMVAPPHGFSRTGSLETTSAGLTVDPALFATIATKPVRGCCTCGASGSVRAGVVDRGCPLLPSRVVYETSLTSLFFFLSFSLFFFCVVGSGPEGRSRETRPRATTQGSLESSVARSAQPAQVPVVLPSVPVFLNRPFFLSPPKVDRFARRFH